MKNILVVYYTQTGQMHDILHHITQDIRERAHIDFVKIEPEQDFPFPWTSDTFFNAMPESVLQKPIVLKPMPQVYSRDYDLVLLGYQPWFLSPSIPSNSFLKSEWAGVLKGKPVVTILGCRNMWLNAQETVKKELAALGARHVGHIALQDNHPNLVSLRTTLRWFFKGQKEADAKLPEAGVSHADMKHAGQFGPVMLDHLERNELDSLQGELLRRGGVHINKALILLEGRGVSQFPLWAQRAASQHGAGRQKVLKKFKRILIFSIFVLSPVSNAGAKLISALKGASMQRKADYFKNVVYKEGMI